MPLASCAVFVIRIIDSVLSGLCDVTVISTSLASCVWYMPGCRTLFLSKQLQNYSLCLQQLFIQRERSRMNLLSKDWPWNKVKCISLTLIPSCSYTLIFYSIGALTARTLYSSEQLKSRYVVTRAWRQGVTVHYFSSAKCSFKRTALEIDHWTSE